MNDYKYFYPIVVRYGDLDPQGHVNNSKYLTYMEQARIAYIRNLGLWRGGSFLDAGVILADARVTFKQAIHWGQEVHVGVRITRLGNKSLDMDYRIVNPQDGSEFATGFTVLVAYDYHTGKTMAIPQEWREKIADFEGMNKP